MSQPTEPIVACDEVQGNILAGFKKDFVQLVFILVTDAALPRLKGWLRLIAPQLAYSDVVLAFNVAFSLARRREGADPPLQAVWLNLAISGRGAKRLLSPEDWRQLDPTFLNGPLADAAFVGEPAGGPESWVIGGEGKEPDVLLIVAGDSPDDVQVTVDKQISVLRSLDSADSSVSIRVKHGQTRSAEPGHEHFGFKDCISQPGVRGRIKTVDGRFITPRLLDPSDALAEQFAAPGQELCWPGEFVLGYPRKIEGGIDRNATQIDPTTMLTRNGSYLVYRRLRQDVAAFRAAAQIIAGVLQKNGSFEQPPDAAFAGACLIGRWPSGAPIMRVPQADDPSLGRDRLASNNFFFARAGAVPIYRPDLNLPPDTFSQAPSDSFGSRCPFPAHIRKVNPRDQATDQGDAARTIEHRILRRGIPYGEDFDSTSPQSLEEDRGLQFLCYQSSIERGFQFLMSQWANSDSFPLGRGQDIVIGQDSGMTRRATFLAPDGAQISVDFASPVVTTTGAAYLFSPSRTALIKYFGS